MRLELLRKWGSLRDLDREIASEDMKYICEAFVTTNAMSYVT